MEGDWYASRGAGVLVGVADTGVDASIPPLRGRLAYLREFGAAGTRHGTHICSTIALLAPAACLAVAAGAAESPAALARALEWLGDIKPAVVNLSLSVRDPDDRIAAAIARLRAGGAWVFAAADSRLPWLSHLPGVLTGAGFPESCRAWLPGAPGTMRGASVATALASGQAALARAAEPGIAPGAFLARADRGFRPSCSITIPGRGMVAALQEE